MKLPFIVGIILLYSCQAKKPDKIITGFEGKPLPLIELLAYDSLTKISTARIDPKKPTILFAFQPTCPYCRAQTRSITTNADELKDFNIYMICISQFPLFKEYYNHYELNKYPNIKAGMDYNFTFANYFHIATVPYIAIYDKHQKLKQVLQGKNYVSTLKDIALQ